MTGKDTAVRLFGSHADGNAAAIKSKNNGIKLNGVILNAVEKKSDFPTTDTRRTVVATTNTTTAAIRSTVKDNKCEI